MTEARVSTYPNGVKLIKWPHQIAPTAESVSDAMKSHGYKVYDLQTVPAWYVRSRHAHDETEIRGAVDGVITIHIDEYPVTIEAGDNLQIPGGDAHEVIDHNRHTFSAYKGSMSSDRKLNAHAH